MLHYNSKVSVRVINNYVLLQTLSGLWTKSILCSISKTNNLSGDIAFLKHILFFPCSVLSKFKAYYNFFSNVANVKAFYILRSKKYVKWLSQYCMLIENITL